MYRFAIEKDAVIGTSDRQLSEAGITPDDNFPESLEDTGEYRENERYFRVENQRPSSPEEAVEYVQGIIHHVPTRIWIDGRVIDTANIDLARVRKPGA